MEEVLKQYDKQLTVKRNLDGTLSIYRQSPFYTTKKHLILVIANQYVGSGKWILKKLISMDTTKYDIVGDAMRHNLAIRNKKEKSNMHSEIADYMLTGSSAFIN